MRAATIARALEALKAEYALMLESGAPVTPLQVARITGRIRALELKLQGMGDN